MLPDLSRLISFVIGNGQEIDKFRQQDKLNNLPEPSYLMCKKCLSNRILIDAFQLRSCDEGQSCICTCSNCGNKWRMD